MEVIRDKGGVVDCSRAERGFLYFSVAMRLHMQRSRSL